MSLAGKKRDKEEKLEPINFLENIQLLIVIGDSQADRDDGDP